MVSNLSGSTIFTKKCGCTNKEEAVEQAKCIEEVAFSGASENYKQEPDGDGSRALSLYVNQCSKLLMEIIVERKWLKETVFDISKGHRAFIDAEEARELLNPLRLRNSYTKICLSNRSFGLPAAYVAEPILASIKSQLKEVDLSDFVAGRPEKEALGVMKVFSKALEGCILRSLNLSNNALGEKGLRAFVTLLGSQTSLEELFLMNDGISEEAAKAIPELIPFPQKLKILQLHSNMIGDGGAHAISEFVKRCPVLEEFQCSSTRIGSEGGCALSEALQMCTRLKKLDLRDNNFGRKPTIVLSESFLRVQNLKEVYLSYLNLGDKGVITLANALKETSHLLEVMDVAGNEITDEAASGLAACIAMKHCLIKLTLAENELMDEGMIQISESLEELVKLEEVDMSFNSLTTVGAITLAQALVHDKPALKLVNVNGNLISNEGVEALKNLFEKLPNVLGPLNKNDPVGADGDEDGKEDD